MERPTRRKNAESVEQNKVHSLANKTYADSFVIFRNGGSIVSAGTIESLFPRTRRSAWNLRFPLVVFTPTGQTHGKSDRFRFKFIGIIAMSGAQ